MGKNQFGYSKMKFIANIIIGVIELVVCFAAASWLRSNRNIFYYADMSTLALILNVLGIVNFVWDLVFAYGYYQMNLEIGLGAIRGKGWNRELKIISLMPQFFQIQLDDVARVENKNMLKVYTKQGKKVLYVSGIPEGSLRNIEAIY